MKTLRHIFCLTPVAIILASIFMFGCSDKTSSAPLAIIDGKWTGLMVIKRNDKIKRDSLRINFNVADSTALLVLQRTDSFHLHYTRNQNWINVLLPDASFGRQTSRLYSGYYQISNYGGKNKLKMTSSRMMILLEKDSLH